MSENVQVITDLDPAFFEGYAKKIKEESTQKNGGNSFTPKEYDDIGYAGLVSGFYRIMRLIGAPPGAESQGYVRKNYDPKQIMMCDVKDDEGKKFTIRLPLREDSAAHNHIMHRIYDEITKANWIPNGAQKKKVFVNENKYPDLWKMITKGNYTEKDGMSFSMAGGFKSTIFTMMNVIDREDDWCKDNKHTKVLCREVNVDDKGNVWAKPGVKSFGFIKRIGTMLGKYGNYEAYDIAIKRTGEKDNPFEMANASKLKSKDDLEELVNNDGSIINGDLIVIGPLTSEEIAYERYDLDTLYQPTSYTKLLKRIPALFKLTDACLGTKYFDELTSLVEKEKAMWAEKYGDENAKVEEQQISEEQEAITEALQEDSEVELPKRKVAIGPVSNLSDDKIALLLGWAKLPDEHKNLIKDVIVKDGKVVETVFEKCDETKQLYACVCGASSPGCFKACQVCGADFD